MRPLSLSATAAARRGRVLVECCVSIVLLGGGSAMVLLMSTSTAMLVDESRQQDLLQRETASQMAAVAATPCAVANGATQLAVGPRLRLTITGTAAGTSRELLVDATWQPSVLSGRAERRHTITSAGRCE